ncbi:ribonuclease R family protein [Phycisphaera mikurensis]|uniref:Ribonuclease R n=1 Tax=Phycisphaera mikurensis (strain NBRC 102666 / KCTC 22515 / FYK2301M01) TaxID=1142394 RepID=I0IE96_PHYMF|nr:VacB/RNase II family 3'-5' exoribonuclease [Phycisphaera mikurensis]MBB6441387.1 ribonuclease R [Phycisphaera mikurensis]BAM03584.1 ribonuclease R [Phycisphaera mikurensis NBRC 102666]
MPSRFRSRILTLVADKRYEPADADAIAESLGVDPKDRSAFETALDELVEAGRIVRDDGRTISLPTPGAEIEGVLRRHPNGFGFLIPDVPVAHGDLFVPPPFIGNAMTGDRVRAEVVKEEGRAAPGKSPFIAKIQEITERADRRYAGVLESKKVGDGMKYRVIVDGRLLEDPIRILDAGSAGARAGDKVVVEIVRFPEPGEDDLPEGVITEVLGEAGLPHVETAAVMAAFGLAGDFPEDVMQEARDAAGKMDVKKLPKDRADLRKLFITTIDPPDAKDYDDAISLERLDASKEDDGASWELGVHIADVAAFVTPGSALEKEAYARGNSTYLPKKVVPMLPEVLSNGVCSLQPNVDRYAKTVFVRLTEEGEVVSDRFTKSVIRSSQRMTYLEAQALIDGDVKEARKHCRTDSGGVAKYPKKLIQSCKDMNELARVIRARRMAQGMIVLGLPEVGLIYDEEGRVVDAAPEDDAYTHKIIEMFMVEANEAAARLFAKVDVPMLRRTHPEPDSLDTSNLQSYSRVAGMNIPDKPDRHQLQQLLEAVRGKPAQQAVHFAVLKTMMKAEYSPALIGHFALAAEDYTHFTSPIRRYPDLIVHRGIDAYLEVDAKLKAKGKTRIKAIRNGLAKHKAVPDHEELVEIGQHCGTTERNSALAERELRNYMVLEMLSGRLGEDFDGTVTGVVGQGCFIQLNRFLVDGFVKISDLPSAIGDFWKLNRNTGQLVADRSGKTIAIGDRFTVRIAGVNTVTRQMDLAIVFPGSDVLPRAKGGAGGQERGRGDGRRRSSGDRGRGDGEAEGHGGRRKRRKRRS